MKFQEEKFIQELENIKATYKKLDIVIENYYKRCEEFANSKKLKIASFDDWGFTANDFLVHILFKILRKDLKLDEAQYKAICTDCIEIILGTDDEKRINQRFSCDFCYDYDEKDELTVEPAGYASFEDDYEEYGEMLWKNLYVNSFFFEEDPFDAIDMVFYGIAELYAAIGEYLIKKFDVEFFEDAVRYYLFVLKVQANESVKKCSNNLKQLNEDELLEYLEIEILE